MSTTTTARNIENLGKAVTMALENHETPTAAVTGYVAIKRLVKELEQAAAELAPAASSWYATSKDDEGVAKVAGAKLEAYAGSVKYIYPPAVEALAERLTKERKVARADGSAQKDTTPGTVPFKVKVAG